MLVVWGLLVLSYTVAAGFTVPPHEGTADPDATGPNSAAQVERLLAASTDGTDRFSISPSTSVHGPTELTIMVGPERSPYPTEGDALDRFMEEGGTLVIFAATEAWNEYLIDHGIRLEGATLLPTANRTTSNILTLDLPGRLGGGQLLMPNATAVQVSAPNVTTFQPDEETVLDVNGNGSIEVPPDQAGAFPVAATTAVGDGQLLVVSSSEAVLGNGLDRNLDAAGGLFESLAGTDPSALDAATHPRGWKDLARAPASATLSVAQASPIGLAIVLVAGAGMAVALPRRPAAEEVDGGLDAYTDVTREVMFDRGD